MGDELAAPLVRSLNPAPFDNAAGRSSPNRAVIGQTEMIGPAVHTIDNRVPSTGSFVVRTASHQPADHQCWRLVEHEVGHAALNALFDEGPMNAVNNLATLAQSPQRRLDRFGEPPLRRRQALCEPKSLKFPHPPDLTCLNSRVPSPGCRGPQVYNLPVSAKHQRLV